jgi:hypothetical protein
MYLQTYQPTYLPQNLPRNIPTNLPTYCTYLSVQAQVPAYLALSVFAPFPCSPVLHLSLFVSVFGLCLALYLALSTLYVFPVPLLFLHFTLCPVFPVCISPVSVLFPPVPFFLCPV